VTRAIESHSSNHTFSFMKIFLRSFVVALLVAASAFAADKAVPKYGCELLTNYVPITKALAADDLKQAQLAATALSKQAVSNGMTGIVEKAKALAEAPDIAKARAALRPLTAEIEPLTITEKNVTVMYCPMARASWVQDSGPVENPYYGKAMLHCGAPKKADR
jgi:hypothetical protein